MGESAVLRRDGSSAAFDTGRRCGFEMHELDSSGRDGALRRDHQGDVAELRCEQGLRWVGVKGERRARR